MVNLKYISRFTIFKQTWGIKWTVPSDFLAKKKQLLSFEGLRPITASIKEGLLLLRSTIVLDCCRRSPPRRRQLRCCSPSLHCTYIQLVYIPTYYTTYVVVDTAKLYSNTIIVTKQRRK